MFHDTSTLVGILISLAVWISASASDISPAKARQGNRLTYLDSNDPFYVGRDFPKLITPQWVGESGVDAVVVMAIDDMTRPEKYDSKLLQPSTSYYNHPAPLPPIPLAFAHLKCGFSDASRERIFGRLV